jgi:hypothetical protein
MAAAVVTGAIAASGSAAEGVDSGDGGQAAGQ